MDLPELTDDDDSDVEEDSIDDLPYLMEQLPVNENPSKYLATGVSIIVQWSSWESAAYIFNCRSVEAFKYFSMALSLLG